MEKKKMVFFEILSYFVVSFNDSNKHFHIDLLRTLKFILTQHYKLQWCLGNAIVIVADCENVASCISPDQ